MKEKTLMTFKLGVDMGLENHGLIQNEVKNAGVERTLVYGVNNNKKDLRKK